MKIKIKRFSILICTALFGFAACTPRAFEKKPSAAPPAAAQNQLTGLQAEVEKMRVPDLKFIFVFRRPDGAAIGGEDKKFLRANLPFSNRIVVADDDKAVVVGSNYAFPPENLDALRARFKVEDFSAQGR